MLIDSHSHIDGAEFQLDIDEVFARMKEAEVGGALVAGTSLQDYERGLNFANAHKNVWYAAGVHPSTKDDDHEASIEELVGLTKPQKVVAIGECGLDYYYEEAPYDAQLERFARHIEAAKLANLPGIVTFPYTTKIRRGFDETAVKAEAPSYTTETVIINKNFNAVSVINLLDILGWGIDAATGAMTKPEFKFYQIDFQPKEEKSIKQD